MVAELVMPSLFVQRDPLRDRHAGRPRAQERDHHVPLHRAAAERGEPLLRRLQPAVGHRRPGLRLLRDDRRRGRGRRGPRDHHLDLPPLRDGRREELQPAPNGSGMPLALAAMWQGGGQAAGGGEFRPLPAGPHRPPAAARLRPERLPGAPARPGVRRRGSRRGRARPGWPGRASAHAHAADLDRSGRHGGRVCDHRGELRAHARRRAARPGHRPLLDLDGDRHVLGRGRAPARPALDDHDDDHHGRGLPHPRVQRGLHEGRRGLSPVLRLPEPLRVLHARARRWARATR